MLGKSLNEIDHMEASEVLEWQYYLALEPRGESREDYHAAQITQAIYTILSSFQKNPKPISLKQSMLRFADPDEQKEREKQNLLKNALIVSKLFSGAKGIDKLQDQIEDNFRN